MHALRTAIFTVKGLKRFMKDGYVQHAKSYEPKCVRGALCGCAAVLSAWRLRAAPAPAQPGTWRRT
jgi:hypothetical protein